MENKDVFTLIGDIRYGLIAIDEPATMGADWDLNNPENPIYKETE